jgi:hypothetical protein
MQIYLTSLTGRNGKGDVFTDRMVDFAQALGYDVIRSNIAKSGREVDLVAQHSLRRPGSHIRV